MVSLNQHTESGAVCVSVSLVSIAPSDCNEHFMCILPPFHKQASVLSPLLSPVHCWYRVRNSAGRKAAFPPACPEAA